MKVKDFVYYILDAIKSVSDDSIINEDHVIFLMKKYRSLLIKRERDKAKQEGEASSDFEYQQVCLNLEKVEAIPGFPCEEGYYLRSKEKLPKLLGGALPKIYPVDFYSSINIVFVSRDRMRFTGTNKFLKNIIYVSKGPDGHLYLKSDNIQFLYLKKLRMYAIFDDFDKASELLCDDEGNSTVCDILDAEFPIRDYLVPQLIEFVEKEILGASYRPADRENNAADDLASLINFIRQNMSSQLDKQIEG